MNCLIIGDKGVGKSTLIKSVLNQLNLPIYGFITKKECKENGKTPVYIYEAGKEHIKTYENLICYCEDKNLDKTKLVFDKFADKLLIPQKSIIVMDEIGFLETKSNKFCNAILNCLEHDIPVIAAVKNKDIPFLNLIKNHNNCKCFYISKENRNNLYFEVLEFMKSQIKDSYK